MRLLVVEDNEILSRNIVRYFASRDIFVEIASEGIDGEYKASTKFYDAIILDINLPGKTGLEICKSLREKGKQMPIIMLTSMGTSENIVNGLDIGADDYLVKPFEYSELHARINALTRRNLSNKSNTIIKLKNIEINLQLHEVKKDNEVVKLSTLEYNLFKFLIQNKGQVLSRSKIYEHVWGEFDGDFMFSKTIDVYIGYLRKKLGREIIETKKGFGYIIK